MIRLSESNSIILTITEEERDRRDQHVYAGSCSVS